MKIKLHLLLVCISLLIAAPAVAQSSTCDVEPLLAKLDSGAKLQRTVVANALRNLKTLTKKDRSFVNRTTDSVEAAYNVTLRACISIPFSIRSCQESSTCSKVEFGALLATYIQSSTELKELGERVAKKLSQVKNDPRGRSAATKLRKRSAALHSDNLNSAATLSATDCRGGRGSIVPPTVTPNPDPNENPLLLTMAGHWNHVAINASGFDHSALGNKEQLGPVRASRAEAIVHIAIFDAVNAATGQRYEPYLLKETRAGASVEAAIAQASYQTLVKLFPSQGSHFATELLFDLGGIPNGKAKDDGIYLGTEAARLILLDRENDGSDDLTQNEPYSFIPGPGFWALDPLNLGQKPLGANWKRVRPFVLPNAQIVRAPAFPAFSSDQFAEAYAEVKRLGGDGKTTPTERTQDQTEAGLFWAYDGTPSLCAPPRLYNQIAMLIANQQGITDPVELTRMLALVNVAMSDAGVASWETKYHYSIARPITAIRQGDIDENPNTAGDTNWTPLGAPATNLNGANFTPPFPAYVSGHATFGGAMFQILRNVIGTDNVSFTFLSDELNGITPGNDGVPRPRSPRSFKKLSEAELENGQSRIYLGIHWSFDKDEGIEMGRKVANFVYLNKFALKK